MKIGTSLLVLFSAALLSSDAHAAIFIVSNVNDGVTDRLYANSSSVPLASGIATMGYFPAGFAVSTNVHISDLIGNFTVAASGVIGAYTPTLDGAYPGYVDTDPVQTSYLSGGNPLIGRPLYSFIGNGSTLSNSTAFALYQTGTLADDVPLVFQYVSSIIVGSPIIGTFGSVLVNYPALGGPTVHPTLNLVPEPSAALLGAIGCIGFLRRRRV